MAVLEDLAELGELVSLISPVLCYLSLVIRAFGVEIGLGIAHLDCLSMIYWKVLPLFHLFLSNHDAYRVTGDWCDVVVSRILRQRLGSMIDL